MSRAAQAKKSYENQFSEMENGLEPNGQAWLRSVREAAMARFNELGFPSVRDEEWKYTNVAPIANTHFLPAPHGAVALDPDLLSQVGLGSLEGCRLVFVNGYYLPELSSAVGLPPGARVGGLAAAIGEETPLLQAYLARYAGYQDHAFVALNTALMKDGAFVYVPEGKIIETPINLVFISGAVEEATVCHPRILIVVERGGQARIVESYAGVPEKVYFTNAVTEIVVGENGVAEHYKLQRESERAYHVATVEARLARNANFSSHSVSLGGALVRNDINARLDGEGCECVLNGLYLGSGEQHVDNHTRIDHVKAHGSSRELYKGVLHGKARGVFSGKIYVHAGAEKTDAKQTNKNLLLSQAAWVDTKPQLEIYNNDVKCTHGSTIGRLDEAAMFYLRSRGIGVEAARNLLTYAFASEMIDRIRIESLRAQLDQWLAVKLRREW